MKLKPWVILVIALFLMGGIAGAYLSLKDASPAGNEVVMPPAPDLSRFSIKDLAQVSTYTLGAETTVIPESLKPKVQGWLAQDFFGTKPPLLVSLNVAQYKTAADAMAEYEKPYSNGAELGLNVQKDKEKADLDGREGRVSRIRAEENKSYITEVLILDGSNLIRIATADLSKYFEELTLQIAKEVAKKI